MDGRDNTNNKVVFDSSKTVITYDVKDKKNYYTIR